MNTSCKIAITGAGLIGALCALQLGKLGFDIILIDAKAPELFSETKEDLRTIALSHFSYLTLNKMGLWPKIADKAFPIKKIHISDQGHFGNTRISAEKLKVEALGYVIGLKDLQKVLDNEIKLYKNIQTLRPCKVTELHINSERAVLNLDTQLTLSVDLLIAADGTHSSIRQYLNIANQETDYHQTAIVCNVEAENVSAIAYERFTQTGPLALLPISENYFSLVWSLTPELAHIYLALDKAAFLKQLQNTFGYHAGLFKNIGVRQAFPLKRIMAKTMVQPHVILLGNAMHTLHPVAGQGFNLGLRDVRALYQLLSAKTEFAIQDQFALLKQYEALRKTDLQQTSLITHMLVKTFSNNNPLLALVRNSGLTLLDHITTLKEMFAERMMGYDGYQPAVPPEKRKNS